LRQLRRSAARKTLLAAAGEALVKNPRMPPNAPSPVALPGLHSPAAGFDQPFEMLAACHDRVRRSLELLLRLTEHARAHGSDPQARDAARDVLRYFGIAAPAHHEDEERHVIPLLMRSGEAKARDAAQRLLDDHAAIQARWAALSPLLKRLAEGTMPDASALQTAAQAFVDVHQGHLALEDEWAFPAAEQQLRAQGDEALRAMGDEMAGRRKPQRA
jgi:hemerythrin-like domain-containing protein